MIKMRQGQFRPHLSAMFLLLYSICGFSLRSAAEEIVLTRGNHVYFKPNDNQRERTFSAQLPSDTSGYGQVVLNFKLSCPSGTCDIWDRIGSFGIVDGSGQYEELLRFMTPYGIGEQWSLDLTSFLPLLKGKQTFRVFIDTWVGPGHPQGNGWLVDASLNYESGTPSKGRPVLVLPLLSFSRIIYGDPNKGTRRDFDLGPLPAFSSAEIVSTITGHGQGNAQNCAEFCPKIHSLEVGTQRFQQRIWRDNCATTVNPNQKGTYQYSRAGWCPGDKVEPWVADVTNALRSGPAHVAYDVEAMENSCRPDSASCSGCTLGNSCEYDGGLHTEPSYYVSAYLILRQ